MSKIAFIFPGQGAQFLGMGKDLYENFPLAKKIFDEADDALGYSIKKICFEGSEEDLKLTANTQPAILVVSVIISEILKAEGITPEVASGHSLGEYSALVAADSIKFYDAVALVHKRGTFMQEAVPVGEGSMAAIIGLDDKTIVDACEKASEFGEVQAVNFNCPGQTVIAGKVQGVEKAVEILKSAGAKKSIILPVSAPFHSTLMKPAAEKLSAELDKIEIANAKFPVAANFTGQLENSAADIKSNLVSQADNPVKWIDCVKSMQDFGADIFVECGPGKTLSNFNKRIDRKIKSFTAENCESLQKTLDALKG